MESKGIIELNAKDMLYQLCRKWRTLLICALCGIILMAGLSWTRPIVIMSESSGQTLDSTFEHVLTTSQPNDILKMMAQQPVDIVLLDMNFTLGVNNGTEGLFWLRAIRKQHPETPIVLLTAYADVNLAVKGLKNGASDFITKPWDNDELVHKLKDVLDMRNEIVSLDEMEKEHIRRTIDHCHGNLTQAAEILGITRQTLYNKIKRL